LKKRKEKEKEKEKKRKEKKEKCFSFNFVFNVDNLARNQLTRSWMLQVKNNLKKKPSSDPKYLMSRTLDLAKLA
jgi:DNA-binding protein H-NS